jgi:hypothetical protein
MEATYSSKISVDFQSTTWCCIPEDGTHDAKQSNQWSTTGNSVFCTVHTDSYVTSQEKNNVFTFTLPLSEEWVGEAWGPANNIMFFLPPYSKVSLTFQIIFHFIYSFYLSISLSLLLAAVFSAGSFPRLYLEDQHDKPVSLVLVLRWQN